MGPKENINQDEPTGTKRNEQELNCNKKIKGIYTKIKGRQLIKNNK